MGSSGDSLPYAFRHNVMSLWNLTRAEYYPVPGCTLGQDWANTWHASTLCSKCLLDTEMIDFWETNDKH